LQTIGPLGRIDHLAHLVRQGGDLIDRIGDGGQPRGIELQPVEHGPGQAVRLARGDIARVGGEHCAFGLAQGGRRRAERRGLGLVAHSRKAALGLAAGKGEVANDPVGTLHWQVLLCGHAGRLAPPSGNVTAVRIGAGALG